MNHIDELFTNAADPEQFADGYLEYLAEVLKKIDRASVAAFARILLEARDRGGRIFFLGNGGSAATASHFANDIAIGSRAWDKPFRALSLTDNVAAITAVANDYGYDEVFVRQLQTLMTPGDVVVAISASGNSPNVLRAVDYANTHGGFTVGLTGFDGGELRRRAQMGVHVPTGSGEYGPAEDGHMIIDHLVGAFVMHTVQAGQ